MRPPVTDSAHAERQAARPQQVEHHASIDSSSLLKTTSPRMLAQQVDLVGEHRVGLARRWPPWR